MSRSLHHDEVPRLSVHTAAREPSRLDDPAHQRVGHRLVLIAAHGQERANGLECVHGFLPIVVVTSVLPNGRARRAAAPPD
jgi:hypothetical protein